MRYPQAQSAYALEALPPIHHPPSAPQGSIGKRLAAIFLPTIAFPVCLLAITFSSFNTVTVLGKYQVGDVLFLASAALMMPAIMAGRVRVWFPWWLGLSALLLWLSFAVRVLDEGAGFHADLRGTAYAALSSIVIPVIVASQPARFALQSRLPIYAWVLGYFVCTVVAILQHKGYSLTWIREYLVWHGSRVSGFNAHPNTLGYYASLAVPVAVARAFSSHRVVHFAAWMAATGCLFYAIDLSGSRMGLASGVLGAGVVFVLFAMYRKRTENVKRTVQLLAVISALLLASQYVGDKAEGAFERLLNRSETAQRSDESRAELTRLSLERFWSNPVAGVGLQFVADAHNLWLSALACGGLLGLASVLSYQLGLLTYCRHLLRIGLRNEEQFSICVGLVAMYAVWLVHGLKGAHLLHRSEYAGLALIPLVLVSSRLQCLGKQTR